LEARNNEAWEKEGKMVHCYEARMVDQLERKKRGKER
jgi:hypothetical protein